MVDLNNDIKIEVNSNEVDYDSKQFIHISYIPLNEKHVVLDAYNTKPNEAVVSIWFKHYHELKDKDIEEIRVEIAGVYDQVSIVDTINTQYDIIINCHSSNMKKTTIEFLSITADNHVKINTGTINIMDCIGMETLRIDSVDVSLLLLDRVKNVLVNSSRISKFIYEHMKKTLGSWGKEIDTIKINHSHFDYFMLYNDVNNLKFNECEVKRYSQRGSIGKYNEVYSVISPAFTLPRNKFKSINIDSCKLGKRAAKVSDDLELYIEYNDLHMKLEKEGKPIWKRVSYWYLNWTTGYGFKPSRALWFSLGSIGFFAFVYSLIDLLSGRVSLYFPSSWNEIKVTILTIAKYLYQSGITYTTIGFADILEVNPVVGLIYVFEAILGISVLSLFIFSLTRKYFFEK